MDPHVTGPLGKDEGYDVSDPTDWLCTPLSSLMQVEQSLRCHVCKEFFNSPMITTCSHTFCSLCIRRALNTDGKCPLCRATDQESKLRRNGAITEAADAFVASRRVMLDLARRALQTENAGPLAKSKRKAQMETDSEDSTSKRTRMSTRSSSAKAAAAAATPAGLNNQEVDSPDVVIVEDSEPDDGLVACPICDWRMKPERVDRHLDTDCPGQQQRQPNNSDLRRNTSRSTGFVHPSAAAAPDRLPSMNYSILNETKLRRKLSDLGIPSWGSRLLLEKRHREWVMIWNANCDSKQPKTKRELLQELDTWERTQGGHASTMSLAANLGAQIKDKDFDGAGWSAKHNNSFTYLISQARRSQKKPTEAPSDVVYPMLSEPMYEKRQSEQSQANSTVSMDVSVDEDGARIHHQDVPAASLEDDLPSATNAIHETTNDGKMVITIDDQTVPEGKVLAQSAVAETPVVDGQL